MAWQTRHASYARLSNAIHTWRTTRAHRPRLSTEPWLTRKPQVPFGPRSPRQPIQARFSKAGRSWRPCRARQSPIPSGARQSGLPHTILALCSTLASQAGFSFGPRFSPESREPRAPVWAWFSIHRESSRPRQSRWPWPAPQSLVSSWADLPCRPWHPLHASLARKSWKTRFADAGKARGPSRARLPMKSWFPGAWFPRIAWWPRWSSRARLSRWSRFPLEVHRQQWRHICEDTKDTSLKAEAKEGKL